LQTEILLATPTSDPRVREAILPPGTTGYTITKLLPSTQYRIEIRHRTNLGPGAGVTIDVTTNSGGSACPAIKGFAILS
jgi:hypothetical protein